MDHRPLLYKDRVVQPVLLRLNISGKSPVNAPVFLFMRYKHNCKHSHWQPLQGYKVSGIFVQHWQGQPLYLPLLYLIIPPSGGFCLNVFLQVSNNSPANLFNLDLIPQPSLDCSNVSIVYQIVVCPMFHSSIPLLLLSSLHFCISSSHFFHSHTPYLSVIFCCNISLTFLYPLGSFLSLFVVKLVAVAIWYISSSIQSLYPLCLTTQDPSCSLPCRLRTLGWPMECSLPQTSYSLSLPQHSVHPICSPMNAISQTFFSAWLVFPDDKNTVFFTIVECRFMPPQ